MIDRALEIVAARLNQHLRSRLQSDEDLVVVTNVVGSDGTPAAQIEDKLALFIVNVERDGLTQTHRQAALASELRLVRAEPLHLKVFVMVAAGYSSGNYLQALKLVSQALQFFQAQPLFDRQTAPELPPPLQRLVFDIQNLGTQELSHLWGVLGGRYLPSVLYLMRTVVIAPDGVTDAVRPARTVEGALGS